VVARAARAAAKAGDARVAPILLPDYVNPEVKEHHLSAK